MKGSMCFVQPLTAQMQRLSITVTFLAKVGVVLRTSKRCPNVEPRGFRMNKRNCRNTTTTCNFATTIEREKKDQCDEKAKRREDGRKCFFLQESE